MQDTTPQQDDQVIDTRPKGVPSGYELLREVLAGTTMAELARKYGCSKQNIHSKIQTTTKRLDPEFRDAYMRAPANVLRIIEMLYLGEAIKPEKVKKMSSYQLTGMADLVSRMRRLEEGQATAIIESRDLVVSLSATLDELIQAQRQAEIARIRPESEKNFDSPAKIVENSSSELPENPEKP